MRGERASAGELKTSGSTLRKGAGPCRTAMPRSMRKPRIWLRYAGGQGGSGRGEREKIALLGRFDRNEVHGQSLHRLGRLIEVVVFVSLEKGLYVLGGDQADVVPDGLIWRAM